MLHRPLRATVAIAAATLLGASIGALAPADAAMSDATPRSGGDGETVSLEDVVPVPSVTAKGWLVYDATTEEPIAAHDPATPRPIASLAKLMTALVVVERVQDDTLVTIPRSVNDLPADASRMDAKAGERWRAGDLLRAMLVYSANDAALALASHVGDGDVSAFVRLMNDRADELGLSHTTFASPTGLDDDGAANTSTPLDLAELARTAMLDPTIAAAVATQKVTLERPGGGDPLVLANRNPLLGAYVGVDGVKTGFTDEAGYMLITHFTDPDHGGELLVVTAGSTTESTRVRDARRLLDWARQFRTDVTVAEGGEPIGSLPVVGSGRRVDLFVCDDLVVDARVGQRLEERVVVPRAVQLPVAEGDELGELHVVVGGEDAGSVPVCSATTIELEGWRGRARLYAGEYREAWRAGADGVRDAWDSIRTGSGLP